MNVIKYLEGVFEVIKEVLLGDESLRRVLLLFLGRQLDLKILLSELVMLMF